MPDAVALAHMVRFACMRCARGRAGPQTRGGQPRLLRCGARGDTRARAGPEPPCGIVQLALRRRLDRDTTRCMDPTSHAMHACIS